KTASRFLALLLVGCAFWALAWGLADLYALGASRVMEAWHGKDASPDDQEWALARRGLALAHRLNPLHPGYLDSLGQLWAWKAAMLPLFSQEGKDALHEAMGYYRRAIALRPTWPYTWARLAQAKLNAFEIDGIFCQAVAKASRFGPHEPQVKTMVWRMEKMLPSMAERCSYAPKASALFDGSQDIHSVEGLAVKDQG
ncbi:MAG: hypothetical protein D6819_09310, partial [Gammaproteobacteria bacterium]